MDNKINYKLVNLTLVVVTIFFIYQTGNLWLGVLGKIISILIPFFFAFALAYALYPFLQYMQKKNIPKGLGISIIVILLLLLLSILIYVVSTILVEQLASIFNNILVFIGQLSDFNFSSDINVTGLQDSLNGIFKDILSGVGNYVSNGTIHLVNTSLSIASQFLIGAAAFVYLLIDMDRIRKTIREFFKKRKIKTFNYIRELDNQMRKYLGGLVIVLIISVFEYSLAYTIIGHPDALLLGFLAGISNFIPYFGGMICNCVAAVTAFVISPSLFVKTIIVFIVLSFVDSYVINANVYGKTNSIHPLLVIFSVFAGSALFGVMGIIISFPLAILIVTTYKFYRDDIFNNIKEGKKKLSDK